MRVPPATFNRGSSQQAWQNANYKTTLRKVQEPAAAVRDLRVPPTLQPPRRLRRLFFRRRCRFPGCWRRVQSWKAVWSWQGNNVDGPIAGRERRHAVREQRRRQRHPVRSGDRAREDRLWRHQYRRRRLAQQGRYVVCRRTRARRRHRSQLEPRARCWRVRSTASRSNVSAA